MIKNFLQKLRRPESNRSPLFYIFSAIIFGMIIVVFAFMSPSGTGSLSGSATAATVGGRVIPILQLQRRAQEIEQQNKMFMPEMTDQFRQFFQNQALNDLINVEILTEVQSKEGLYVSDGYLAQSIMDIPAFQEKGVFKRDLYETYLLNSGQSANFLEERIKKDLRLGLLRNMFESSFLKTSVEDKIAKQVTDFDIKMEFVDISEQALLLNPKLTLISDQETEKELSNSGFKKRVETYYSQNSFKYKSKEKVKARWILVLAADQSEASYKKAEEKIKNLKLTKSNFSDLAKSNSDDPTAQAGGDLGYVEKGTYDKDWDQAAFSTPVGQISQAFKTPQGWARVLIEEKKEASLAPLKDVESKIARELIVSDRTKLIVDTIKKSLNESPEELDKVLKSYNLSWVSATDFKLSSEEIPGFGSAEQIFDKLLTLKKDGQVYNDVVSNQGKNYLIKRKQFIDKQDSANKDFQAVTGNRYSYALGSWFESQRKQIRVKVNPIVQGDAKLF